VKTHHAGELEGNKL